MKVLIVGVTGEGKTTVANLLHENLESCGVNVTLKDDSTPMTDEELNLRLKAIASAKTLVEIETIAYKDTKLDPPFSNKDMFKHLTMAEAPKPTAKQLRLWLAMLMLSETFETEVSIDRRAYLGTISVKLDVIQLNK